MKTIYIKEQKPTLKEAQELVGGYVAVIDLPDNKQMMVDEEGLLKRKEINREASAIAGQVIVGDAVVLSEKARWQ